MEPMHMNIAALLAGAALFQASRGKEAYIRLIKPENPQASPYIWDYSTGRVWVPTQAALMADDWDEAEGARPKFPAQPKEGVIQPAVEAVAPSEEQTQEQSEPEQTQAATQPTETDPPVPPGQDPPTSPVNEGASGADADGADGE